MLINYWKCKYANAEEEILNGDDDDIETETGWNYYCEHPDNPIEYCELDNQFNDEEVDCKFLD